MGRILSDIFVFFRKKMKVDVVRTRAVLKTYAFEKEDVKSEQQMVLEVRIAEVLRVEVND